MKKTMSALSALLLSFVLFLSLNPPVLAEDAVVTKAAIKSGVSFRDKPATTSNVMRYLKAGEIVTVTAMVNPNWYQIKDAQGVAGYVSSGASYITLTSNAKIVYGVNFRTAPSTSGTKIRMLSKGEEVLILEKANDNWYKVKDQNGATGYVSSSSQYINPDFSVAKPVLPLEDRIESFIAEGMKYMGTPYEFGSDRFDTATFDCSDFVQQSFWDATRIVLPGDSRGQGEYVKSLGPVSTDWTQLKRGDLMFFMSYKGSRASDYAGIDKSAETITHVGIYLGDGTMLQTFSPESGGVRIDGIAGKSWEYRFLYGGSVTK